MRQLHNKSFFILSDYLPTLFASTSHWGFTLRTAITIAIVQLVICGGCTRHEAGSRTTLSAWTLAWCHVRRLGGGKHHIPTRTKMMDSVVL